MAEERHLRKSSSRKSMREKDEDDTASVMSSDSGSNRRSGVRRSNSMESTESRDSKGGNGRRRSKSKSKSSRRSSEIRDGDAPTINPLSADGSSKRDIREPKKGRAIFDESAGGGGGEKGGRGRRSGSPGRKGADDEERKAELQARLRSKTVDIGDYSGARFKWSKPKVVTERERARILKQRSQILDRQRRKGMKESEIETWASKILSSGFRAMIKNERAKRAAIHQQQMDLAHLKDFWAVITSVQGLPIYKQKRIGGKPVKRFVWVDEDMWRLMCHNSRSMGRKDVTGLFLLDISAIWKGCKSHTFRRLIDLKGYERDPACCMSLVGAERTIDMVFSSSSEREAMYQLFSLLVKSIHQKAKERSLSQYQQLNRVKKRNKFSEFMSALNLVRSLQGPKGVRVMLVLGGSIREPRNLRLVEGGRLIAAKLSHAEIDKYNEKAMKDGKRKMKRPNPKSKDMFTFEKIQENARQERTYWSKKRNSNFYGRLSGNMEFVDINATRGTEEGMFMTDCVECRPGMFSPVFADLIGTMKTNIKHFGTPQKELSDLDMLTVTLIASERTFSMQFATQRDRDLFVSGMSALIARCSSGDEVLVEAMLVRPMKQAMTAIAQGGDDSSTNGVRMMSRFRGTSFSSFSDAPANLADAVDSAGDPKPKPAAPRFSRGNIFSNSFKSSSGASASGSGSSQYAAVSTKEGDLGGVDDGEGWNAAVESPRQGLRSKSNQSSAVGNFPTKSALASSSSSSKTEKSLELSGMNGNHEAML